MYRNTFGTQRPGGCHPQPYQKTLNAARREFEAEEERDAIMHRNTFGTQRAGGPLANAFDLQLKNPANTNVIEWGGRLLSLWEVRAHPSMSALLGRPVDQHLHQGMKGALKALSLGGYFAQCVTPVDSMALVPRLSLVPALQAGRPVRMWFCPRSPLLSKVTAS